MVLSVEAGLINHTYLIAISKRAPSEIHIRFITNNLSPNGESTKATGPTVRGGHVNTARHLVVISRRGRERARTDHGEVINQ